MHLSLLPKPLNAVFLVEQIVAPVVIGDLWDEQVFGPVALDKVAFNDDLVCLNSEHTAAGNICIFTLNFLNGIKIFVLVLDRDRNLDYRAANRELIVA